MFNRIRLVLSLGHRGVPSQVPNLLQATSSQRAIVRGASDQSRERGTKKVSKLDGKDLQTHGVLSRDLCADGLAILGFTPDLIEQLTAETAQAPRRDLKSGADEARSIKGGRGEDVRKHRKSTEQSSSAVVSPRLEVQHSELDAEKVMARGTNITESRLLERDLTPARNEQHLPGDSIEFPGVSWNASNNKWRARFFNEHRKRCHLGFFDTAVAAAEALRELRVGAHRRPHKPHDERAVSAGPLGQPSKIFVAPAQGEKLETGSFDLERGTTTSCAQEQQPEEQPGGRALGPTPASSFTGVRWRAKRKRWEAHLRVGGKKKSLGFYKNEEDAARAVDRSAGRLGRPLNFPRNAQN